MGITAEMALGAAKKFTKKEMHRVYKPAGSKTVAELTSDLLVAENLGNVYNAADSGVTTSDFVEGPGKTINAGDNIDIVDIGSGDSHVYKFDLYYGGSGGGTTDYNQLSNQPQINSVQLKGNKSADDLNLASKTDITDKADKVRNATSGHLAGLDSNGNLTDSGVSPTEDVTIEGNPVTFDSPFEQDAKNVVVSVKPIQDLHGYDHPWPAGGGKNKLQNVLTSGTTSGGLSYIVDDFGVVTIPKNQTPSSTLLLQLNNQVPLPDGTYILNGCPANGGSDKYALRIYNATNENVIATDTGVGSTFTLSGGTGIGRIQIRIQGEFAITEDLVFRPMIRLATESDATFAPYSNECPISGIDEVEIEVSGKNILPKMAVGSTIKSGITYTVNSDGSINVNNTSSGYSDISIDVADALKNFEGETVFFSGNPSSNNNTNIRQAMLINGSAYFDYNEGVEITLPDKIETAIYLVAVAGTGTVASNVLFKPQIELGSTPTEFEPYVGHTTTIPLPQTVYDADVDVTEGDATENDGFIDLGALSWSPRNDIKAGVFAAELSGYKFADDIVSKCEAYKFGGTVNSGSQMINKVNGEYCFLYSSGSTSRVIFILDETKLTMTGTEFKTAVTGSKLVYKLATPTTISFDPTDVELLKGTNVVTTNGESIELTYLIGDLATFEDVKDCVDAAINKAITQVLASSY